MAPILGAILGVGSKKFPGDLLGSGQKNSRRLRRPGQKISGAFGAEGVGGANTSSPAVSPLIKTIDAVLVRVYVVAEAGKA